MTTQIKGYQISSTAFSGGLTQNGQGEAIIDNANFVVDFSGSGAGVDITLTADQLTVTGTPSTGTSAVNKTYVDTYVNGLTYKAPVRVATTANITLENLQTVDGVALSAGDRVLVKDQSSAAQNGIYLAVDGGAWTRSDDANIDAEVTAGMYSYVTSGTANGTKAFVLITTGAITLGVTSLTFDEFPTAGLIIAGDALQKVGDDLDVLFDNATIGVNGSNQLYVLNAGIDEVQIASSALGDGLTGGSGSVIAVLADPTADNIDVTATGIKLKAGAAGSMYISNGTNMLEVLDVNFVHTITGTDVTNGYVDVSVEFATAYTAGALIFLNGLLLEEGASNDYEIDEDGANDLKRITLHGTIQNGDKLRAKYLALA